MKLTIDIENPQELHNAAALINMMIGLHAQQQPAPCAPVAPGPMPAAPPQPVTTAAPMPSAAPVPQAPAQAAAAAPVMPQAQAPAAQPQAAPAAPGIPAAQPDIQAPSQVDTTMLRQRLSDITRQLGPRNPEVGALIQKQGVAKVSMLSPEQLQTVLAQAEALLGG